MGSGSRQTHAATMPPEQFYCLLDELPLHLITRRQLDFYLPHDRADQPLFLNPECSILSAGQVPPELEPLRHSVNNFCLKGTVAWVRDPVAGSVQPFLLGPRLQAVVASLRPDEPVAASLPPDVQSVLAAAGILTTAEHSERRISEWREVAARSAVTFREKEYVPIGSLLHPFQVAALRRYYRCAIRRGAISLGDHQSARRYVAYNDSVARFFHYQLANAVSAVVGEAIKPSYVYFASYLGGAELKKHTDRAQCEFSVTLCLDFSPEPILATPWPIRLETPQGTVAVYQALGDGLVYRGTQVPHYRERLREGFTSTSIFFHYVPAGFSGSLD